MFIRRIRMNNDDFMEGWAQSLPPVARDIRFVIKPPTDENGLSRSPYQTRKTAIWWGKEEFHDQDDSTNM
jgi:hypothetical protein